MSCRFLLFILDFEFVLHECDAIPFPLICYTVERTHAISVANVYAERSKRTLWNKSDAIELRTVHLSILRGKKKKSRNQSCNEFENWLVQICPIAFGSSLVAVIEFHFEVNRYKDHHEKIFLYWKQMYRSYAKYFLSHAVEIKSELLSYALIFQVI